MKPLSCHFVSGVWIILGLIVWIAAFPIGEMLIIALFYVDSLVSNKECGFSPGISLNINTDAFLLAGLFPSGNLISFRVFTYLVQISQWTSQFLKTRSQRDRQLHTQHGSHKPHFLRSRSHLLLFGCRSIQACKSSVN